MGTLGPGRFWGLFWFKTASIRACWHADGMAGEEGAGAAGGRGPTIKVLVLSPPWLTSDLPALAGPTISVMLPYIGFLLPPGTLLTVEHIPAQRPLC